MYRQIIRTLLFLVIPCCASLDAQSVCSTRAMAGVWAASSEGIIFPTENPPPVAGPGACVGLVSIDYGGQISIQLACNTGGVVNTNFTAVGTVKVNSDCTGTLNALTPGGWTLTEEFVVLDNGNQVRTIAVGGMLRNKPAVWQCLWKRQSHVPARFGMSNCSAQTTRGTWAGSFGGAALLGPQEPPTPLGILSRGTIDYNRKMSGVFTGSRGGEISHAEYAGWVTEVNPDCTGKWSYTLKLADGTELPGEVEEQLVILDHGQEIWGLPVKGLMGMPIGLSRYWRISPTTFE